MSIGIYCFKNIENGKSYVGQSVNIESRHYQHRYRYNYRTDKGYGSPLYTDMRKYGYDKFEFSILELCDKDYLLDRENFWIDKLNSYVPNGYNAMKNFYDDNTHGTCTVCGGRTCSNDNNICCKCYFDLLITKSKEELESYGIFEEVNTRLPYYKIDIEFIKHILDTSYENVARELGYVSGNSIIKKLKNMGIPSRKKSLLKWYNKHTGSKHPNTDKIMGNKPINQAIKKHIIERTDEFGNKVVYKSCRELIEAGFSSGHISECARGKRKKYKGFTWRYIE